MSSTSPLLSLLLLLLLLLLGLSLSVQAATLGDLLPEYKALGLKTRRTQWKPAEGLALSHPGDRGTQYFEIPSDLFLSNERAYEVDKLNLSMSSFESDNGMSIEGTMKNVRHHSPQLAYSTDSLPLKFLIATIKAGIVSEAEAADALKPVEYAFIKSLPECRSASSFDTYIFPYLLSSTKRGVMHKIEAAEAGWFALVACEGTLGLTREQFLDADCLVEKYAERHPELGAIILPLIPLLPDYYLENKYLGHLNLEGNYVLEGFADIREGSFVKNSWGNLSREQLFLTQAKVPKTAKPAEKDIPEIPLPMPPLSQISETLLAEIGENRVVDLSRTFFSLSADGVSALERLRLSAFFQQPGIRRPTPTLKEMKQMPGMDPLLYGLASSNNKSLINAFIHEKCAEALLNLPTIPESPQEGLSQEQLADIVTAKRLIKYQTSLINKCVADTKPTKQRRDDL